MSMNLKVYDGNMEMKVGQFAQSLQANGYIKQLSFSAVH